MTKKMVWSETEGKMVELGAEAGEQVKVSISLKLAETLKGFATEDGFDFSGISYVTQRDKTTGKTLVKDGKPVYVMENGKPKTVPIAESVARVNSAISQYANVAIQKFIAERANGGYKQ